MKKTVRLTESDLIKIVKRVISEQSQQKKTPDQVVMCLGVKGAKTPACKYVIDVTLSGKVPTDIAGALKFAEMSSKCGVALAQDGKTIEDIQECVGGESSNLPIQY